MSTSPIGRKPAARPAPRAARQAPPAAGRAGRQPLDNDLPAGAEALREVAAVPDTAARERAALRTHVEKTLLGVFGPQLALSPRFQDIVTETVEALVAEPALQATLQQACRDLLAAQAGGGGSKG